MCVVGGGGLIDEIALLVCSYKYASRLYLHVYIYIYFFFLIGLIWHIFVVGIIDLIHLFFY